MQGIFCNGKRVGYVEDGIYVSHRTSKIHYCVLAKGYPISSKALEEAVRYGAHTVWIIETKASGKRVKYACPIKMYLDAEEFQLGGFDKQKCIPLDTFPYQVEIN